MSVKISGLVWDRYEGLGNEFVLALAIADHSHDDGTHIFPSVSRLSKKARISERTVQRILNDMQKSGWLIKVSSGLGGRNFTTEYKINPDWVKGDKLSPFISEQERVTPQAERVTNDALKGDTAVSLKGDIAVSPEPSLTNTNHQEPSPREKNNITEITPMRPEGLLACRLIKLNVAVTSMHPTLCKWVTDNIPIDFIEQCIALARQNKPWPEKIAAGYLDAIIRNELKPKADNSWLMTDEGTIAKGRELRIEARAGESMSDYRQRLRNTLGLGANKAAA